MKKMNMATLGLLPLFLTGCAVGEKAGTASIIYGAAAMISLLLLVGYCFIDRKKNLWIMVLFSSVLVVNSGYFWLSVANSLSSALMANRFSYLGSVFLPLSMLMIILDTANLTQKKWLSGALITLAGVIFCIAASPGILPIYYKEVTLKIVDGVTTLNKVYGPLHSVYLYYLLGYFATMLAVIIHAIVKKELHSPTHAVILLFAVLINIGVWLVEQLVHIDFEILSVSYIITELFLLGIHRIMKEQRRLLEQMAAQPAQTSQPEPPAEELKQFRQGLALLTPTERAVFEAYTAGKTSKEVMEQLNITENTLKFHNKHIYAKFGVSSRKQLLTLHLQAAER